MNPTASPSTRENFDPEDRSETASSWLRDVAQWDDAQADAAIRQGLPVDLVVTLQDLLSLTDQKAAGLIDRARSTYARYRNSNETLTSTEAERAVRFAQLLALAAETFGDVQDGADWMRETNYRLGDEAPLEMAHTELGARVVRDLLLGIQHGHPA